LPSVIFYITEGYAKLKKNYFFFLSHCFNFVFDARCSFQEKRPNSVKQGILTSVVGFLQKKVAETM